MAKKYSHSSPWVLIVPLVIAIVVVLSAVVMSQRAAYTRSKASFDPVQACVDMCNKDYRRDIIKDPAACALDCPGVVAPTPSMTCTEFCQENVKQIARQTNCDNREKISRCKDRCNQNDGRCLRDCENNNDCPINSSIGECKTQCQNWVGDPCAAKGMVCKDAIGAKKDEAKTQCAAACELVKNEENTCDEAMTASSLRSVNETFRKKVLTNCKNYFE